MSLALRTCAALGALALLVALAGCTPARQPVPAASHTASVAEATPPLEGGDCAKLLDSASLAAALGWSTNARVDAGDPLLAVVGGIGCDYEFGASSDSTSSVWVVVAPSAIADASAVATSLMPPECTPGTEADCAATVEVAGWWYSLDVNPYKPKSAQALRASFDAVKTALETTLRANRAPKQHLVQPFDCATAVTPDGRMFGSHSVYPDSSMPHRYSEIQVAAFLLAGPTTCSVNTPDASAKWSLTVYPGGASAYSQCANSSDGQGTSIAIPGVKTAFAPAQDPDDPVDEPPLCATDGTSTITVVDRNLGVGDAWGQESPADLGSILVPTFRAARSSATVSVTPWTASLPDPSAPVPVHPLVGGDCNKLLNTKAAGAALGTPKLTYVKADGPLLATVGGLGCDYRMSGDGNSSDIQLQVAPGSIADPVELAASRMPARCGVDLTDDNQSTCAATVAVAGWWFSLSIDGFDPNSDEVNPKASFAAIAANLDQTLKSTAAPGRIAAKKPVDCQSADTVGWPVTSSRSVGHYLTEVGDAGVLLAGAEECDFTAPNSVGWRLTVYPGSAAAYYVCTQVEGGTGSRSVSVPGVKTAVALAPDSGPQACATDGTSTVFVEWERPDDPPWNTAALKTLGSLLVPAFEAAK